MMPKMPKNMDTCRKSQDVVKYLLSSTVQNQLSTLGFFPIPLDVRSAIRLVMHFMLKLSWVVSHAPDDTLYPGHVGLQCMISNTIVKWKSFQNSLVDTLCRHVKEPANAWPLRSVRMCPLSLAKSPTLVYVHRRSCGVRTWTCWKISRPDSHTFSECFFHVMLHDLPVPTLSHLFFLWSWHCSTCQPLLNPFAIYSKKCRLRLVRIYYIRIRSMYLYFHVHSEFSTSS